MNADTRTARILCFLVPFVYLTTAGVLMHCVMAGRKPEHFGTVVLVNVFVGVMAGGIFLSNSFNHWRDQCAKRDRTIAEMNHHVRNALSVLAFYGTLGKDQEAQIAVNQAIKRIEWTLEEILPSGWSHSRRPTYRKKMVLTRFQRISGRTTAEVRQR